MDRTRTAGLMLVLCALASPVAAQTAEEDLRHAPPKTPLEWVRTGEADRSRPTWHCDLDLARNEALWRNCPLLVVVADNDAAAFGTALESFKNSTFCKLSQNCVLVIAVTGSHETRAPKKPAARERRCSEFGGRCVDHRRSHLEMLETCVRGEWWQPLYLLFDPGGEERVRFQGIEISVRTLVREVELAQGELGPSTSHQEYRRAVARLESALRSRERKGAVAILRELERHAQRRGPSDSMRGLYECVHRELLTEGRIRVSAALALSRTDRSRARENLREIADHFAGYGPGVRAQQALASLEPNSPPTRPREQKTGPRPRGRSPR